MVETEQTIREIYGQTRTSRNLKHNKGIRRNVSFLFNSATYKV